MIVPVTASKSGFLMFNFYNLSSLKKQNKQNTLPRLPRKRVSSAKKIGIYLRNIRIKPKISIEDMRTI